MCVCDVSREESSSNAGEGTLVKEAWIRTNDSRPLCIKEHKVLTCLIMKSGCLWAFHRKQWIFGNSDDSFNFCYILGFLARKTQSSMPQSNARELGADMMCECTYVTRHVPCKAHDYGTKIRHRVASFLFSLPNSPEASSFTEPGAHHFLARLVGQQA